MPFLIFNIFKKKVIYKNIVHTYCNVMQFTFYHNYVCVCTHFFFLNVTSTVPLEYVLLSYIPNVFKHQSNLVLL